MRLDGPLPLEGSLTSTARIVDVQDKVCSCNNEIGIVPRE